MTGARQFSASFAQQRVWFLQKVDPAGTAFNLSHSARVRGPLDVARLRSALDRVITRHESLRTCFAEVDGEILQVVRSAAQAVESAWDHVDLTGGARDVVAAFAAEGVNRPFDLEQDSLLRFRVADLGFEDHVVVVTVHHIICDDWSMGLLLGEISELYDELAGGVLPAAVEPEIQYVDFTMWEREVLTPHRSQECLDYWLGHLDGAPVALEIGQQRSQSPAAFYRGGTVEMSVPADVVAEVLAISRRLNVTLFIVLLATFETFLARVAVHPDLVVGVPFDGRTEAGSETLIGMFVNTLALRADLRDNPSFEQLVGTTRETMLNAREYGDLPFERVVEGVNPDRVPGMNPLFQVMFQLLIEDSPNALRFHAAEVENERLAPESTFVDLALDMVYEGGELRASFNYNCEVFNADVVAGLAEAYLTLLAAVVADPRRPVLETPLLTPGQEHDILQRYGRGPVLPVDAQTTVLDALFDQARLHPSGIALSDREREWSFAEVTVAVDAFAAAVRSAGADRGDRVALLLSRTGLMPVAMLGVLRAGAVLVALDPETPVERLRVISAEAGVGLLVTEPGLSATAAAIGCPYIEVSGVTLESSRICWPKPDPEDPAYVVFTSGSSGVPRGVLVRHGSLTNLFASHLNTHYVAAATASTTGWLKVAFTMSPAFDACWDQLLWMAAGHQLVVIDEWTRKDAHQLLDAMRDQRISVLESTPSLLEQLAGLGLFDPREHNPSCVVVGGEAIRTSLWDQLAANPHVLAVNLYGPTEFTVDALGCTIDGRPGPVVGRPLANTRVLILDRNGHPVPTGVTGEMYLAGPQIATGYLNQPATTAQQFLPHPYPDTPGERIYRTGDLARFTSNGDIQFLGRLDRQIKIRGHRIEPGDIETALLTHPAVHDVTITTQTDNHHDTRLTAYVVAEETCSAGALRAHLATLLPNYLMPDAFAAVAAIPRNISGKVVLEALIASGCPISDHAEQTDAPRAGVEQLVAELFVEVLGVPVVSRCDHFFRLGGHSLSAVKLISRIRAFFGTGITLRTLFENPTVAELAACTTGPGAVESPLRHVSRAEPGVLSFAQERIWFLQESLPENTAYNMVESIRLDGALDIKGLSAAIVAVVARHEILRTVYLRGELGPVQRVAAAWSADPEIIDLTDRPAIEAGLLVDHYLAEVIGRQHDLSNGPGFSATILRLAPSEHVLVIGVHHIAADGWSVKTIFSELSALYRSDGGTAATALAEPVMQYLDFAAWERDRVHDRELVGHLGYWTAQIEGAPLVLDLPATQPRPVEQSGRGGVMRATISPELTAELTRIGIDNNATLFGVLLSGFHILLARWCHQDDVLVGVPVAGRTQRELEDLIGFFVNTLPIRGNIGDDPRFVDFLVLIRDTVRAALVHQDLPFERLVEALNPDRSLGINPVVQATCQLFEEGMVAGLELAGITATPYPADVVTSRFDISLDMVRQDGGLQLELVYNSDVFDQDTANRMVESYQVLLREIARDPSRRVSALPLMSEPVAERVLREYGRGPLIARQPRGTIVDSFRNRVQSNSEAVALVDDEGRWTYKQIARAVDLCAERIRLAGAGPGDVVALDVKRSAALVVSILATLTNRSIALPLDHTLPDERLRQMLRLSGVRLLVASETPAYGDIPTVVAVRPATWDGESEACYLGQLPGLQEPAYLAFTSGSSGVPKGVIVRHDGLANLLTTHAGRPRPVGAELGPRVRVAHTAPFSFDLAWDLLLWMIAGHELHMVSDEIRRDAEALVAYTRRQRIDVLNVPPSFAQELLGYGLLDKGDHRPSLLALGGEGVRAALWRELSAKSGVTAANLYGPTEFTVASIATEITGQPLPVIGRPLANTRVLILDRNGHPVPTGVTGEMYLAGPQIATGYLNQPATTAQQFLPHPYPDTPGERIYRTGDLARFTSNGDIQFLGRLDRQIKIRGHRIEPGDIETALLTHPAVHDVTITTQTDNHHDTRLTAYVIPDSRFDLPAERAGFVESWKSVFEDVHLTVQDSAGDRDAAILGWQDSFTGQPIAPPQMAEWVGTTVDRLAVLRPRRILEIGAGTGLLLRPLCQQAELDLFVATDFSAPAVKLLESVAGEVRGDRPEILVEVRHAEALDAVVRGDGYDTVIINSVAQYFPSLTYLDDVIGMAIASLNGVGHVFLGDLRNGKLADAFFSLREDLRQGLVRPRPPQLRGDVIRAIRSDGELSIDPDHFLTWYRRGAGVTGIEIAPRRGESHNEMNLFRYDVILHVGCPAHDAEIVWEDGFPPGLRLIEQRLAGERHAFGFRKVANARLRESLEARDAVGLSPVNEERPVELAGTDPEALWRLGDRYGWKTRISWGNADAYGTMDVSFVPAGIDLHHLAGGVVRPNATWTAGHRRAVSARALAPRMEGVLTRLLRADLAERLPEYMIPRDFVYLAELPRLTSGKIHFPALPDALLPLTALVPAAASSSGGPARDRTEIIRQVMGERLAIGPLGSDDDFFAVGGDSLTAAMVARDLGRQGLKIAIRDIFTHRTPDRLAWVLQSATEAPV